MSKTIEEFKKLSDAEEFLKFFELPYDQKVVNVNRLHILKKFSQYIQEIDEQAADLTAEETLNQYCLALQQAYEIFLESTPQEQKVFKVFKDKPKNVITLTELSSD
ncbi:nitrogenase stabilizing/protective protein [Nostoc sp. MBR 210]|uniref:Nitrogenase-stabilizing/protective protein NifW n=1 Tax=Nostoc spongiaeforme FACHB-130 TaxID=1357510 RepID=A0ABR8FVE1_9NOSO|nr:nitrogenase-stabilizing/protective protein NifW [Nostoc spongiaeforme]MBD2595068.1 nitrogenase-stabilizing/protective protein NifW [Nostoc spongiaeforme FACHB-130]OCQ90643.1 nitrogenase stabilizing/protective protein [Nostoc sp. MBR 210]